MINEKRTQIYRWEQICMEINEKNVLKNFEWLYPMAFNTNQF